MKYIRTLTYEIELDENLVSSLEESIVTYENFKKWHDAEGTKVDIYDFIIARCDEKVRQNYGAWTETNSDICCITDEDREMLRNMFRLEKEEH